MHNVLAWCELDVDTVAVVACVCELPISSVVAVSSLVAVPAFGVCTLVGIFYDEFASRVFGTRHTKNETTERSRIGRLFGCEVRFVESLGCRGILCCLSQTVRRCACHSFSDWCVFWMKVSFTNLNFNSVPFSKA